MRTSEEFTLLGFFFFALLFVVIVAAIPYGVPLALLMIGWMFFWRRLVNAAMAQSATTNARL